MTPRNAKIAARILLGLAFLVICAGTLGPEQGWETRIIPWDKASHFIGFYGLTLLAVMAFPNSRRNDLALAAVVLGGLIELAQSVVGRDGEIGDLIADALGAAAVVAPTIIEEIRSAARHPQRAYLPLTFGRRRRSKGPSVARKPHPMRTVEPAPAEAPIDIAALVSQVS